MRTMYGMTTADPRSPLRLAGLAYVNGEIVQAGELVDVQRRARYDDFDTRHMTLDDLRNAENAQREKVRRMRRDYGL